ncbi:MAG: hypothetical protein ACKPKO_61025, partial [Candidatus Fonsibacter sp.]
MYSDTDDKRLHRVIVNITEPLMEWHTCHNLATRSGAGTLEWAMLQCSGGYLLHLSSLVHVLCVSWVLDDIGFSVDTICLGEQATRSPAVSAQDSLAAYVGNKVLGLLGSRIRHAAQYLAESPMRRVLLASQDIRIRSAAALSIKSVW